jgi:hypothetical protein
LTTTFTGVCDEPGDIERKVSGIARVFYGTYNADSRGSYLSQLRYWYEGSVRGMDMEGFGRIFYYDLNLSRYNMFVGYLSVEHYDHNQKTDDRKAFGGHGVFMGESGTGQSLAVRYQGIYRLDNQFTDPPCVRIGFTAFRKDVPCN